MLAVAICSQPLWLYSDSVNAHWGAHTTKLSGVEADPVQTRVKQHRESAPFATTRGTPPME